MTVAVERRHAAQPLQLRRYRRTDARHPRITIVVLAGGTALAFLGGRDGSSAWQVGRIVAVVAITALTIAALARASQKAVGHLATALAIPSWWDWDTCLTSRRLESRLRRLRA